MNPENMRFPNDPHPNPGINLENVGKEKKEKTKEEKLDEVIDVLANVSASDPQGLKMQYRDFKGEGFSADNIDEFKQDVLDRLKSDEGNADYKNSDWVKGNVEEFVAKIKLYNEKGDPEDYIFGRKKMEQNEKTEGATEELTKVSMEELSKLDPESGGENGDFASVVYLFLSTMYKGKFSKEELINELIASEEERGKEFTPRILKTVENFFVKGYLKEKPDGEVALTIELS